MHLNSRGLPGIGTTIIRTAPVFTGELARGLRSIGTAVTRTSSVFTGELVHPTWV